jgi:hypothetical protein
MERRMTAALKAARSAARAAAAAGAPGALGGPANADARAAMEYARSRLGAYGWGQGQMSALINLWNGESGWNRLARNPSSGAFGIPQALPASKMGAAANPPASSAAAQINWGLGYIRSVYGSPGGAYGAWLSRSPHWYDKGGWLGPGATLAWNGTNRPERVTSGAGEDAQLAELRGLRQEVRRQGDQNAYLLSRNPAATGLAVSYGLAGANASRLGGGVHRVTRPIA